MVTAQYETTVRAAVECSGIGFHSGAPVNLKIKPAAEGSGIVFRRTDLDDFEVEATPKNLAGTSYATSFMKRGVHISSTQHLLSALVGMGVDNAMIELDNLEVPILDGSSQPFVEMLLKAGFRRQRRERTYLRILRPYEMREGNQFIGIYPADQYSLECAIDFAHPLIGIQRYQLIFSTHEYMRSIAPARTFQFVDDKQTMMNRGLIRGLSRENCVLLTRKGIENPPLRFHDEFVRHKISDLMGDLSLLGSPILGRVEVNGTSHSFRLAAVSRILREQSYFEKTTLRESHQEDLSRSAPSEQGTVDVTSVGGDFAITFDERLKPNAIRETLSALADYYRACGGVGLQIADVGLVQLAAEEPVLV